MQLDTKGLRLGRTWAENLAELLNERTVDKANCFIMISKIRFFNFQI